VFTTSSFQDTPSPPMTPVIEAAAGDSVQVLTNDGRKLQAGRAVLFNFWELGFRRTTWLLGLPPILWVVELVYRVVANHRRLFSRFLFRRE
jgi:predicted DCC family thiol-disulfide oxidoreductase YuxK